MRAKLQQLRIKHLTLLDGIGSLGSLHAVASAMHMTQPALTNMLQEIEAIFGAPLFVRSKRGLTANSVGTALIWRARLILNELARADSEVTEILGGRIEITMGVTPMMMLEIIPSALAEIEKAMPKLRLTFVERNVPTLLSELAQGKIDIVLSSVPHDDSAIHEKEAFEYLYLFDEELCVMVRNGHELASKKNRGLERTGRGPMGLAGGGLPDPAQFLHGIHPAQSDAARTQIHLIVISFQCPHRRPHRLPHGGPFYRRQTLCVHRTGEDARPGFFQAQ